MSSHMENLALANETRLGRAAIRRDLKAGRMKLETALDDPHTQSMKVFDLLCYLPVNGPSEAKTPARATGQAKILTRACNATESTTVENLGARRRALLLAAVRGKSYGRFVT